MWVCWLAVLGQGFLSHAAAGQGGAAQSRGLLSRRADPAPEAAASAVLADPGAERRKLLAELERELEGRQLVQAEEQLAALPDAQLPWASELLEHSLVQKGETSAEVGPENCQYYTKNGVDRPVDDATCRVACCTGEGLCGSGGGAGSYKDGKCECGIPTNGAMNTWRTICIGPALPTADAANATNATNATVPVPVANATNGSDVPVGGPYLNLTAVRRNAFTGNPYAGVMYTPTRDEVDVVPYQMHVEAAVPFEKITSIDCLRRVIEDPTYKCSDKDMNAPASAALGVSAANGTAPAQAGNATAAAPPAAAAGAPAAASAPAAAGGGSAAPCATSDAMTQAVEAAEKASQAAQEAAKQARAALDANTAAQSAVQTVAVRAPTAPEAPAAPKAPEADSVDADLAAVAAAASGA